MEQPGMEQLAMTTLLSRMASRYSLRSLTGADVLIKAGSPTPTANDELYVQFTGSQYSPRQVAERLAENLRESALRESFQPVALILDIFA